MSNKTLLLSLFSYKSWADNELLALLAEIENETTEKQLGAILETVNHAHVDRIFASNLQQQKHSYRDTGTSSTPTLAELSKAIKETDRWYLRYVEQVEPEELAEAIRFAFTDGAPGQMSREEMLAHVITHGGYHRGEVGRIVTQLSKPSSPDTFTGYLHQAEPARRAPV
ncbi:MULTISPECIES: DinB family protein [unclassified Mesorhizobium]|uniref:DinB family protein n=1 Tax=unclassified Mesorhizobium TaxID=325217 RepID=UPI000FCC8CE2|nr:MULTISPECIES: DinB family protein [unclassified Mesorhizobium]RUU54058.1 damage-inducible protein DinB [Mesorhizobium sp. M7A.T.Ca.TU.009.01.1.1]RUU73377.1 damage-inducible protein DinB [Mesorhizobium sp. M7A.T.Ca.TU.009.01.1.2]RUT80545.1 damage-inducible protein DinB [Mesorhizobium sp. M7A.T.Ca.US.000.02.1.1]RUT90427.1 damage-inducible protein DinB [Mesorhizobium sp. M7A.T.Ca.US.000.02.2.1]RUT97590.1 damage-inducible protein DinB [Mesorhizobium sp. M7A.T.Ca.TU.009.02.1.1]